MSNKIKRVDDVIWREIDGNVVIVKEDGSEIITLNPTAAYIWDKCSGEIDVSEIAAKMQEQFDASFEEIYDDVITAVKRLEDMGLLKKINEP